MGYMNMEIAFNWQLQLIIYKGRIGSIILVNKVYFDNFYFQAVFIARKHSVYKHLGWCMIADQNPRLLLVPFFKTSLMWT